MTLSVRPSHFVSSIPHPFKLTFPSINSAFLLCPYIFPMSLSPHFLYQAQEVISHYRVHLMSVVRAHQVRLGQQSRDAILGSKGFGLQMAKILRGSAQSCLKQFLYTL